MKNTLYAANFPPETTPDDLRELFGQHGDITAVEVSVEEKTGRSYALITFASEKHATKALNTLNGHRLNDYWLAVSYPDVNFAKDLTSRQRRDIEQICATLDETEKVPVRRIEAIIRLCGASFAQALAEEALEMAAGDAPLVLDDESRPRTKGGHFFYLARYRMAPAVRQIVYNRKGKMPVEPAG